MQKGSLIRQWRENPETKRRITECRNLECACERSRIHKLNKKVRVTIEKGISQQITLAYNVKALRLLMLIQESS
jgi:hypothetical protein